MTLTLNKDTRNLEFKQDMSETFFISGEGVVSFAELTDRSLYLPIANAVLILHDWDLVKVVNVVGRPLLRSHLLLPGFDIEKLPFRLAFDKDTIDLRNVKTGNNDVIIKGTTMNEKLHEELSYFTVQNDGGF